MSAVRSRTRRPVPRLSGCANGSPRRTGERTRGPSRPLSGTGSGWCRSTTSPESTGSTCGRRTSSRVCSQRCACAPMPPRGSSRRRTRRRRSGGCCWSPRNGSARSMRHTWPLNSSVGSCSKTGSSSRSRIRGSPPDVVYTPVDSRPPLSADYDALERKLPVWMCKPDPVDASR